MAYLTQPDYVKYVCSCGQLKPITSLYFCRHCLKIRCSFCVSHEIDSHFCANCLENMPSSEARLKKNRCCSCFECPSCFHSLSTRATMAQPRQLDASAAAGSPAGDASLLENKTPKKLYYLSCFNCRWTSRDVGIPDQPVASGGWPERANPHATRVNQLMEFYKAMAQQEKQDKLERERKKFTIRGKYITLTDKTGLTGAMARNLAGLPDGSPSVLSGFTPSQPSEEVEGLPEDIYTKEVDLKQITSMAQRLAAPEWQPATVERLHPLPRALTVKRSQRCRECDHNITKPEYGPGSIKFKIELLAYYHVPEVKIISCETLKPGCQASLLLKLTNPTGYEMHFRLLQPEDLPQSPVEESDDKESKESIIEKETITATKDGSTLPPSLSSLKEALPTARPWERVPRLTGASRLDVPAARLSLAQRDDAAEYDDDQHHATPHHQVILWRKSNKMALRLTINVPEDAQLTQPATVVFAIEYSYRNTVPPSASLPRQPQDHTLYTTVMLDLGVIEA